MFVQQVAGKARGQTENNRLREIKNRSPRSSEEQIYLLGDLSPNTYLQIPVHLYMLSKSGRIWWTCAPEVMEMTARVGEVATTAWRAPSGWLAGTWAPPVYDSHAKSLKSQARVVEAVGRPNAKAMTPSESRQESQVPQPAPEQCGLAKGNFTSTHNVFGYCPDQGM